MTRPLVQLFFADCLNTRTGGLELLSEVHDMAAVMWDRDCADVLLEALPEDQVPCVIADGEAGAVLRMIERPTGVWTAYTGPSGNMVAWWSPAEVRWLVYSPSSKDWKL